MAHVTEWLQAYHDGEIDARRATAVEAHLARCEACRVELAALTALSDLLRADSAPDLMPEERFVAQVGLQLPRRHAASRWERALSTGWRLAPVLLVAGWMFFQAAVVITTLILASMSFGDGVLTSLLPPAPASSWLEQLANTVGLAPAIDLLSVLGLARKVTLLTIGVPLVFGLLVWSWLASWWAYIRHQQLAANGERS